MSTLLRLRGRMFHIVSMKNVLKCEYSLAWKYYVRWFLHHLDRRREPSIPDILLRLGCLRVDIRLPLFERGEFVSQ